MKIAHLADIHIRNFQYFDEILFTFERLYSSLKQKSPDVIVICGDIFHNKLTVSSEYFSVCCDFFKNLSDISPVYITLGNHDLALENPSRVDSISPVVSAIDGTTKNKVFLLKNSGIVQIGPGFVFCNYSILDDKKKWPNTRVPNSVSIALYHGSINGCMVDNGWISRGNKDDLDIFSQVDYAFLGDIHKFQFLSPKIAYPGSLRQNSYGEEMDKGYLLWDIQSKDTFTCERVILDQKRYFYTLEISGEDFDFDSVSIKKDSRIRVKCKNHITFTKERQIRDTIKKKFSPCNEVPFIPSDNVFVSKDVSLSNKKISISDIRSDDVQKSLIEEYFSGKNIDKQILQELFSLDKTYNAGKNHALRNVVWSPSKIEWSNLFSYGESNFIDFSSLSGVVGIFGENASGKSSISDIICYCLFNSINKEGANKNADYVNFNKNSSKASMKISCADSIYSVERITNKVSTKSGDFRVTNDVCFSRVKDKKEENLNGETKPDTNKNIQDIFGTIDDFTTISVKTQFGLTRFIDARGTERKKIFSKFLDLDIFESKYQAADKDYSDILSRLKSFSGEEERQHSECLEVLSSAEASILMKTVELENLQKQQEILSATLLSLRSTKAAAGMSSSRDGILQKINKISSSIQDIDSRIIGIMNEEPFLVEKEENLFLERDNIQKELSDLQKNISENETRKKKSSLLLEVPCGDSYPSCKFIKDAHAARNLLKDFDEIKQKQRVLSLQADISNIDLRISKCRELKQKQTNLQSLYDKRLFFNSELESLRKDLASASNFDIEDIDRQIAENENFYKKVSFDISSVNSYLSEMNRTIGKVQEKLSSLQNRIREKLELERKCDILKFYCEAMGKNGISYTLVSKFLPIVESEANIVLSKCVDYKISIKNNEEEKSISIYISDRDGERIAELASGFEKTMISLALTASLWKICSLPKSSFLILDESFGFVEESNFDCVVSMISSLKDYFSTIFVISHDINLKSIVDYSVKIEKVSGYSVCRI